MDLFIIDSLKLNSKPILFLFLNGNFVFFLALFLFSATLFVGAFGAGEDFKDFVMDDALNLEEGCERERTLDFCGHSYTVMIKHLHSGFLGLTMTTINRPEKIFTSLKVQIKTNVSPINYPFKDMYSTKNILPHDEPLGPYHTIKSRQDLFVYNTNKVCFLSW